MPTAMQIIIFVALGQMILLAAIVGRELVTNRIKGRRQVGVAMLILLLSAGCYLVCSDKALLAQTGQLAFVLAIGSFVVPAALWAMARMLFDDDFQLSAPHIGMILTLLILGYWNALIGDFFGAPVITSAEAEVGATTRPAQQLMNLGFLTHAFYVAWRGWAGDLINERRRFRTLFVAAGASVAICIALVELVIAPGQVMEFHAWAGPPVVLSMVILATFWILSVDPAAIYATAQQPAGRDRMPDLAPGDQVKCDRLTQAMEQDHLYREHGLTISQLADHVSVPEHQLRQLINQALGYSNFAAFLNTYRLGDVEAAFKDPAMADTPILTIATDAGFQSIATFNRAFRQAYNQTPTDFRRRAQGTVQN